MRRIPLLALLGLTLWMSAGAAAAASTPGTLSSTEYQQIVSLQSDVAGKAAKGLPALISAVATCRRLNPVSSLVGAERNDCIAALTWAESNAHIVARLKVCSSRKTIDSRFACLLPDYSKLSAAVRVLYHAEVHLHALATAREFNKTCVLGLGDGPKAIAHEAQMVRYASRMVLAMRGRDALAAGKWGSLYDAATDEAEASASRAPLTACPHD